MFKLILCNEDNMMKGRFSYFTYTMGAVVENPNKCAFQAPLFATLMVDVDALLRGANE